MKKCRFMKEGSRSRGEPRKSGNDMNLLSCTDVSNTTFTRVPVCSLMFWWESRLIVDVISPIQDILDEGDFRR